MKKFSILNLLNPWIIITMLLIYLILLLLKLSSFVFRMKNCILQSLLLLMIILLIRNKQMQIFLKLKQFKKFWKIK